MRKLIQVAAIACATLASPAGADGFALGGKAGTLGLGIEATTGLSERWNLRAGINHYSFKYDETASDVRYDIELDLRSTALLLDWHPFNGIFRFNIGIVHNKNQADLTATPTANQTIGGTTYTPGQIGTLNGNVSFKKTAPYAGVGWGKAVSKRGGVSFNAEVGALFQGAPEVTLTSSSGTVSQADLRREEQEIENDLDDLKIYPVLSVGLSYQF